MKNVHNALDGAKVQSGNTSNNVADGDGLNDGWEVRYGMNPLSDNRTDGVAGNDPGDDPDDDGLTNAQESDWNTDPDKPDSDGDGKTDGWEAANGSDPNDGSDTQARGTVTVPFTFGDHSGSHSEKYRLAVSPESGDPRPAQVRVNHYYGQTETVSLVLICGARYTVTLGHAGTKPDQGSPDYDYTLTVSASGLPVIVDDPEGIIGVNDDSDPFFAAGKSVTLGIVKIEMITPAGDPEGSPVSGGDGTGGVPDGANEFNYSDASTGVLTLER
jgi:hypothetical protein